MSQRSRVLPGFGLSLGFTLAYVSFIVLIPLAAVFIKSFGIGWDGLWEILTSERILKSLQLSFSSALIAAFINVVFGLLLAWCLVRYNFPGKRLVDALVDLPLHFNSGCRYCVDLTLCAYRLDRSIFRTPWYSGCIYPYRDYASFGVYRHSFYCSNCSTGIKRY